MTELVFVRLISGILALFYQKMHGGMIIENDYSKILL